MDEPEIKYRGNDQDCPSNIWKYTSRIGDGSGDHEEEYLSFVSMVARLKPQPDILDIGCGLGRFLILGVSRHAASYWGLEPDKERHRLAVGKGLHAKKIHLLHRTSGQFRQDYPGQQFDVYLSMVLQHVSTHVCDEILRDVAALLKPDGLALVATTHHLQECFGADTHGATLDRSAFDSYAENFDAEKWGLPVRHFSQESFVQALEAASLDVLMWRQFSYYRPEALESTAAYFGVEAAALKDVGTSQFALVVRADRG